MRSMMVGGAALAVVLGAVGSAASAPPGAATQAVAAQGFKSERISVRVVGRGPNVVLIPGLSSTPQVWASTVAAVPGYRYHLVQLNGFGAAPAGGAAQGEVVAPAAAEVARYVAEAGLRRPALVGHSLGGTVAMMVAARSPERVGRLMVVDMFPFLGAMFGGPGATPDSVRPIAEQIRQGIRSGAGPAREAMARQTIASMVKTEALRAEPVADSLASDADVSARAMYELVTTDLRPELPRITAPTTVLYVLPAGAPMTEAQIDEAYRQSYAGVRGARLQRVADSYHFIMFDQPERFRSELRSFLAATP